MFGKWSAAVGMRGGIIVLDYDLILLYRMAIVLV